MNNYPIGNQVYPNKNKRLLKIMRVSLFFLLFSIMFSHASTSYSQSQKISLNLKSATIEQVCEMIEQSSIYSFVFSGNATKILNKRVNVKADDKTIDEILETILRNTDLEYKVIEEQVVVYEREEFPNNISAAKIAETKNMDVTQHPARIILTGTVVDNDGLSLPGVNIYLKSENAIGTVTDVDGKFSIAVPNKNDVLVFTFIGMENQEVEIKPGMKIELKVTMKGQDTELGEVVITGIFTRKKEDFTGSSSTYTGKELKTMGTPNILQSLKTLDPSFAIIDDNQFGSDPNRLPNMEIRGKSSMLGIRDELEVDPNQPLFILDGFESSLSVINDLDINRVASITILKDAASTAIYGSKAANGVVVVETVKPEAGKLQVSYNGNLNVSMPDLTSYNLMNAAEKLQFEKLAGRYDRPGSGNLIDEINLNKLYNEKLAAVESGVDTYWLAEPVRVGANQKHSIYVRGGEGNFLFGLGAGYNGVSGVVKNSSREVANGNIDLIYRVSKFQFTNKFSLNSTNLENPVVAFNEYAATNPYYKKYNDEGGLEKWLENNDHAKASNPLWNDKQNSRNIGKNLSLSNYFIAEYFPTQEWKVRARVGLTYENDETERFQSPNDTRFDDVEIIKKGLYNNVLGKSTQFEGELSATYAKVFAEKHQINAVAGGNIYGNERLTQGYAAQGFPEGDFTYPSFSSGYPEGGRPTFYESISRSVNGYLNVGYAFNNRYLADLNLRTSGSSVFGVSKRYNTTWSVGLAWNIHNEKFIKYNTDWIDYFKIRSSIGNPGNQSFDSSKSMLVYAFQYGSLNNFGLGATISQLGNPNLQWQTTVDRNIGLDLTVLDNRLTVNVDYYHKVTDPLLISISMPTSSGTSTYLTNAGQQTSQGLTAQASFYIIRNLSERFTWMIRANARQQKNELGNIGNKLAVLNASGRGSNQIRYYDGSDPDNIWAVKSAGIDPSTGKELFYDKDGNYTYDYSYDNEVICGNTRPDLEGILGTSLSWKGFSMSMNFRYQLGRDVFNNALYSKVENISTSGLNSNIDKRALYERWQKPGDIVRFKDIANAATTPMSSRFIQRENVLSLESIYVGYEFLDGWVQNMGLSSLKVQVSMRDVFRASTITAERGIAFPFSRSFEAGLSLNF